MKYVILALVLSGCSVIGPGERGVRFYFGKASPTVAQPGAYVWCPFFAGMKRFNVQVQKSEVESGAASKDMQEIVTHVAVNWSISADRVYEILNNVGDEDDILSRIITPAVNEVMKQASAKRTAEESLSKRLEMKSDIDEMLKARLAQYGVTLHDVSIVNFKYSTEFMQAVERKQVAEQKAKEAEYVAQKAIQDAKAEVNRARGQAEAQQLTRQSLTREILQNKIIEKWDGKFPVYMSGNNNLPIMLNVK